MLGDLLDCCAVSIVKSILRSCGELDDDVGHGTLTDHENFRLVVGGVELQATICEPQQHTIYDAFHFKQSDAISPNLYRNADVALLVYDVKFRNSFKQLEQFACELNSYDARADCVKVLIGSKLDMVADGKRFKAVRTDEARRWAVEREMLFAECSAHESVGVLDVLEQAVRISSVYCEARDQKRLSKREAMLPMSVEEQLKSQITPL